jgi:hypothetical protein
VIGLLGARMQRLSCANPPAPVNGKIHAAWGLRATGRRSSMPCVEVRDFDCQQRDHL